MTVSVRPPLSMTFGSLLRADFTVLLRNWNPLLFNIGLPIFVLFITAFESHTSDPNAVATLVGIAIAYGFMSSDIMGYTLNLARDRENGVFQRLRVTPTPTWAIMVSRLIVHLVVNIALAVLVATIGAIMHGLPLDVAQYLLLIPAAIVAGAVFLSIGQALAGLLSSSTLIAAIGRVVFIVLGLVGILGLTGVLGSAFKTFSKWTPIGATVELFHKALAFTTWTRTDIGAILACLGYIVLFGFLGIRFFRWDAR